MSPNPNAKYQQASQAIHVIQLAKDEANTLMVDQIMQPWPSDPTLLAVTIRDR